MPGRPFLAQVPIKGVTEWNGTPVSRLLPCVLISLSCCVPACQEGLCFKSAAATAAPAASAPHAHTPTHARRRIWTPTAAGKHPPNTQDAHWCAPLRKAVRTTCHIRPSQQHGLSHYAELSPCYQTRHTRAQAHLQPEYFWVTGLFGSTPINSSQHSISVGWGGKLPLNGWGKIMSYKMYNSLCTHINL